MSNEGKLIDRYETLHKKESVDSKDVHTTTSLAVLVAAEAIAERIDRLTGKLAEVVAELKNIARFV